MTISFPAQAKAIIATKAPRFKPKVGIILGSGLGPLTNHIENTIVIPYHDLPGFHACTVEGHDGQLFLGTIKGVPVACLKGRSHFYEGASNRVVCSLIRTLKLIGCEILLATNAAGSLNPNVKPGELMLITDHINFQFNNPLVGENDNDFGPRFIPMENAYDPDLRRGLLAAAKSLDIDLHQGIYISTLGPSYETPAEIRAFRLLGADAIGMSTVPEVIVARHCGLRVAVVSVLTNMAAGLSRDHVGHEKVLAAAEAAAQKLSRLMMTFLATLSAG